jgi:hypothetical protein
MQNLAGGGFASIAAAGTNTVAFRGSTSLGGPITGSPTIVRRDGFYTYNSTGTGGGVQTTALDALTVTTLSATTINGGTLTLAAGSTLATTGAFSTTLAGSANITVTLPGSSGTMATLAGTENLSNKTLVNPVITAGAFSTTLSGSANITLTLPGVSGTIATLAGTESLSNKTLVTPVIGVATGTSLAATGLIKSSSASAGVGYATGAGGAVTQITDATTAVTLDKISGQVTTVALTTAAGAEEEFTVNNSAMAETDVVITGTTYTGAGTPAVFVKGIANGSFVLVISNLHGADALNDVVVVNFAIIKSVAN